MPIDYVLRTVNTAAINDRAFSLPSTKHFTKECRAAWLLKALTCIDLTTLAGDDTHGNVSRLCYKAARPLSEKVLNSLGFSYQEDDIHTAAVCVYPSKVTSARETLDKINAGDSIKVASVATGFPSGQVHLTTRLCEIEYAVDQGANEIDIVIDRSLVLTGQWDKLYDEIKAMKEACGDVHMKAILGVGELGNLTNVHNASMVAMMAGADFIKTSTGKEATNATLPVGLTMCRAIREFSEKSGKRVGLKPAGGIKTSNDALAWLVLIKEELGEEYMDPQLFRIGASGLLGDIERELHIIATGNYVGMHEFRM